MSALYLVGHFIQIQLAQKVDTRRQRAHTSSNQLKIYCNKMHTHYHLFKALLHCSDATCLATCPAVLLGDMLLLKLRHVI